MAAADSILVMGHGKVWWCVLRDNRMHASIWTVDLTNSESIQGKGQAAELLIKNIVHNKPDLKMKVMCPGVWVLLWQGTQASLKTPPPPLPLSTKHTQIRGLVRVDDTHLSDRQILKLARNFLHGRPDPRKRRIIHGQQLQ